MRIRLDLSYDGTDFHGWAQQPGQRTVQGVVQAAMALVLRLPEEPQLVCAGRTDTGVHARGQVVHVDLDTDPEDLGRRLRRMLPADVQVRDCRAAPDGFDARFSALERRYVYRLCDTPAGPDPLLRSQVVAWRHPLDVGAMTAAAGELLGEHDFAAFCKKREGATTIRTLRELRPVRVGDLVETTVRADAFCHSMVRALMGALVAAGEGRHGTGWAGTVLAGRQRSPHVRVMPAHGLTLEEVVYPADDALADRARQARRRRDEDGD